MNIAKLPELLLNRTKSRFLAPLSPQFNKFAHISHKMVTDRMLVVCKE